MINPVFNRTKVVATMGPASSPKDILSAMIMEGVDVCRLNFSHGSHEDHRTTIETIRQINDENQLNISILCDLQGPKIRIGELSKEFIELAPGDKIHFTTNKDKASDDYLYITYQNFPNDVAKGDRILLDDGKLEMVVNSSNRNDEVEAMVIHGGKLKPKKGVNLPNTKISLPCLTDKDLKDLEFILTLEPDWIALSFVREAGDIHALRAIIEKHRSQAKIIAKIEKPQALENIDAIIEATDAIMIARGDLGVEVPMEELPLTQKNIVKKCLQKAKPVIIATQIMESMVDNPNPTRAEINDVANAVLDGADALMLSGETSVGKYPVQVIQNMQKIIRKIESQAHIYYHNHQPDRNSATFLSDSLCHASVNMAKVIHAKALVGMTISGYTGYKLSSWRPEAFIFIFSRNKRLIGQLNLVWGVRSYYYDNYVSTDKTIEEVNKILEDKGFVEVGELVINTASMPIDARGRTNSLKISIVQ